MASKRQNVAKYEFRSQRGRVIRAGITKRPLPDREAELRREEDAPRGYIEQVGRRTTEEAARKWESEHPQGTPPGG